MDLQNQHQQHQFQNQQANANTNTNSGLLRFRSAPRSLFANLSDNSEPGRMYSRFLNGVNDSDSVNYHDFEDKSAVEVTGGGDELMNGRSELPPQYPMMSSGLDSGSVTGMNGAYGVVNSLRSGNNLARQNSSPAGFFAQLDDTQNGYGTTRGARNFRSQNHKEVSPSVSRLGLLSQISEIGGNESNAANCPDDLKLGNQDARFYGSGFPFSSWTDSDQFMEDDEKFFSPTQNGGDQKNRARVLSHHLSLPKNSVEMAAMERLMQFQDSVPCKVRAKRGCATHPRSIAERVRRTRISERMRKLQELVPNMDKQTNTADMLDLAVDYIKDLQKQYKTLSDSRAKCKCLNTQRSIPKRTN